MAPRWEPTPADDAATLRAAAHAVRVRLREAAAVSLLDPDAPDTLADALTAVADWADPRTEDGTPATPKLKAVRGGG